MELSHVEAEPRGEPASASADHGDAAEQLLESPRVHPVQHRGGGPVPEPADADSIVSEPLIAQTRREKLHSWRLAAWANVRNIKLVTLVHFLLTAAVLLMASLALICDKWRVLRVNREALLLLWKNGGIEEALLNSTITWTRSQRVFEECFLGDFVNATDPFSQYGCHDILIDTTGLPSNGSHQEISGLIQKQSILGRLFIFIAIIVTIFQIIATASRKLRPLFSVSNALLRAANNLLGIAFLICHALINKRFQANDPGFPVPWPKVIRDTTDLDDFLPGPYDFFFAMVLQGIALALDLWMKHNKD